MKHPSTATPLLLACLILAGGARPSAADAPPAGARAVTDGGALPEPAPFDSATAARYADVARRLAAAMGTSDAAAFRALHTDAGWERAGDWWQEMLAGQRRSFGPVRLAMGPFRGVIRAGGIGVGVPPDGAAVLLLFERDAGAAMSFVLGPDGRIADASVWVQRELAAADTAGAGVLWRRAKGAGR